MLPLTAWREVLGMVTRRGTQAEVGGPPELKSQNWESREVNESQREAQHSRALQTEVI